VDHQRGLPDRLVPTRHEERPTKASWPPGPDGHVTVTFDTVSIELPKPLDRLVLAHLARRGQASYASRPSYWLFPGSIPGKHLVTENIRGQLVQRGIQPSTARRSCSSSPPKCPRPSWPTSWA
jgi:hypothetical protein